MRGNDKILFFTKKAEPVVSTCEISFCAKIGKVYTMDVRGSSLIVGCSGRLVVVYDLRNLSIPQQTRESSLKYQTRLVY